MQNQTAGLALRWTSCRRRRATSRSEDMMILSLLLVVFVDIIIIMIIIVIIIIIWCMTWCTMHDIRRVHLMFGVCVIHDEWHAWYTILWCGAKRRDAIGYYMMWFHRMRCDVMRCDMMIRCDTTIYDAMYDYSVYTYVGTWYMWFCRHTSACFVSVATRPDPLYIYINSNIANIYIYIYTHMCIYIYIIIIIIILYVVTLYYLVLYSIISYHTLPQGLVAWAVLSQGCCLSAILATREAAQPKYTYRSST